MLIFREITAAVSSNLVNALNFLLFDIFLLSLVFFLTSDVSGRFNDMSLRNYQNQRLHVSCPPLIGGGLSGTSFWRAQLFMCLRVIAFAIILIANLTITGSSEKVVATRNATVLTLGSLRNMTDKEFVSAGLRRSSCIGVTNTTVYYGELRDNQFCETNRSLIPPPAEYVKSDRPVNVTIKDCVSKPRKSKFSSGETVLRCSNAVLQCLNVYETLLCRGIVRDEGNVSYVCERNIVKNEHQYVNANCKQWRNLDYKSEFWLDGLDFGARSLKDDLDATYGAGTKTREVLYLKDKPLTHISGLWFVVLFVKGIIVVSLLATSCGLWVAGYTCRVNDERQLSMLLRENLGQDRSVEPSVFLNARQGDGSLSVWASAHSGGSERNLSRNLYEADYY